MYERICEAHVLTFHVYVIAQKGKATDTNTVFELFFKKQVRSVLAVSSLTGITISECHNSRSGRIPLLCEKADSFHSYNLSRLPARRIVALNAA
jgi:hypothetical protein